MSGDTDKTYVSRGGLKLAAALEAFGLLDGPMSVAGCRCADLGANVGGFTDCLLQAGAAHVYAVDTAYGELAWTLRQDERVTVVERTNALYFDPRTDLATLGQRKANKRAGHRLNRAGSDRPNKAPLKKTRPDKERSDVQGQKESHERARDAPSFTGVDLVTLDLGWTPQKRAIPTALQWLASNPNRKPIGIISLIKPHYEIDKATLSSKGDRGVLPEAIAMATIQSILDEMPTWGVSVAGHILSPIQGGGSRGRKGNIESLAWLRPKT